MVVFTIFLMKNKLLTVHFYSLGEEETALKKEHEIANMYSLCTLLQAHYNLQPNSWSWKSHYEINLKD